MKKKTQVACAALMDEGKCTCVATGCGAAYMNGGPSFDITFDGDMASSVFSGTDLRLTKSGT